MQHAAPSVKVTFCEMLKTISKNETAKWSYLICNAHKACGPNHYKSDYLQTKIVRDTRHSTAQHDSIAVDFGTCRAKVIFWK